MLIYPKEFFKQNEETIKEATCFVLMPFNEKYIDVYNRIRVTLNSNPLFIECSRADDFHRPHIIETILKGITHSEFVIADLTESNANVYYELGLTHSIKEIEKVIILTQELHLVPFDITQFRCIEYKPTPDGMKKLKKELISTFNAISHNKFRLKLTENKLIIFSKKLTGIGHFLYEMKLESSHVGHDGIKLKIYFIQLSADGSQTELETQYLYLPINQNKHKIDHIPWHVCLLRTQGKEAFISIEKQEP